MGTKELYAVIVEAIQTLRKDRLPQCILHRELLAVLHTKYKQNTPSTQELQQMIEQLVEAKQIKACPTLNNIMSYYLTDKQ